MPVVSRRSLIAAAPAALAAAWSGAAKGAAERLSVSKKGGRFRTVQEAIDAVPRGNQRPVTIEIRKGIYTERITVPRDKPFVRLVGEDAERTVLTYNLSTATTAATSYTASTYIYADNFQAENISFENTYGTGSQAVALFVGADRAVFRGCRFLGWQDTLYLNGPGCHFVPQPLAQTDANNCAQGRHYFDKCYIEGHVDFIFGDGATVFHDCHVHSKGAGYVTAQSRTYPDQISGFVFDRCRLTGANTGKGVYLGRPWRPYSRTVFLRCWLGEHILPDGWSIWNGNRNHETAYYAEYQSEGPGAHPAARVAWSHQLTTEEAANYTMPGYLKGSDGWNPEAAS